MIWGAKGPQESTPSIFHPAYIQADRKCTKYFQANRKYSIYVSWPKNGHNLPDWNGTGVYNRETAAVRLESLYLCRWTFVAAHHFGVLGKSTLNSRKRQSCGRSRLKRFHSPFCNRSYFGAWGPRIIRQGPWQCNLAAVCNHLTIWGRKVNSITTA